MEVSEEKMVIPLLQVKAASMIELVHQTAVSEFSQVLSILEKLVLVALEHMEKDSSSSNSPVFIKRRKGLIAAVGEIPTIEKHFQSTLNDAVKVERVASPLLTPVAKDIQTEQDFSSTAGHEAVQKSPEEEDYECTYSETQDSALKAPAELLPHGEMISNAANEIYKNDDDDDIVHDYEDSGRNVGLIADHIMWEIVGQDAKDTENVTHTIMKNKDDNACASSDQGKETTQKRNKKDTNLGGVVRKAKKRKKRGAKKQPALKSQLKGVADTEGEKTEENSGNVLEEKNAAKNEETLLDEPAEKLSRFHEILQQRKKEFEGELECPLCPFPETTAVRYKKPKLLKHCREQHFTPGPDGKRIWECSLCSLKLVSKGLNSISRVLNHLHRRHGKPLPPDFPLVKCPNCPFISCDYNSLKSHADFCEKVKGICPECGKEMLAGSLSSHMKHAHRSEEIIKHPCSLCEKEFANARRLHQHQVRCHSSAEKQFLCSVCPWGFVAKFDLKAHMFSKHGISLDEKIHACTMCNFKTVKKHDFKRHMEIHTEEREHICEICGKGFRTAAYLARHRLCHMEKTVFCDLCDFTSSSRDYLHKHMRLHQGYRHFCSYCEYSTVFKENLKKHVRLVHKDIMNSGLAEEQQMQPGYAEGSI